jgi:hypothetical protein
MYEFQLRMICIFENVLDEVDKSFPSTPQPKLIRCDSAAAPMAEHE